ncbi:hypothetical protein FHG87_020892 [Trinorchestia longiramus]|nr:hypothetical protein FHG87_020892 [Trinorchestia longiramus]
MDPRDRGRGLGPGVHGPPPPPRPDQRDRRKDPRTVGNTKPVNDSTQDTRGDPRSDQGWTNTNDPQGRGGRSLSRDRSSVGGGSRKLNDADPTTEGEPPPAISSADLDQLMEDFDLNDPLEEHTAPAATTATTTPANATDGKQPEKPAGLAGALPGGLGAGLSSLPNPMGDANIMGKLGDLATQNPSGVVNCRGNYNKENRRRVFRLPKEQSERPKWLDVLPHRENFLINPDKFFICEIHWGADPPLIKLHGCSVRPGIPPSIFNVPASCLTSPKPAPCPAKVEDQQLRYFLQKDKITSFDAFKHEQNLQKQYKNLIISRSKERLVCLFMTDNFSECSLFVIAENKSTLCSPLTFSAFKNDISVPLFKTLHPNNGLRSYTRFDETVRLEMNYEIPFDKTIQNLRDFLVLLCKRKLQYITSSIDKDQVLRETFDKVQTLQQKNMFLLVDEVQIRPTVSFSGGVLSGMAENNRDCKATSMLCVMMKSLHKGPSLMISMTPVHKLTAACQLERVKEAAAAVERAGGRVIGSITDNHKVNQQYYVKELYESENGSILTTTTLTQFTVNLSRLLLQNVQYILKIFNDNVVASLKLRGCRDTAKFIQVFLNWWDVMNVSARGQDQRMGDPYRAVQDPQSTNLQTFLTIFQEATSGHGASRIQRLTRDTKTDCHIDLEDAAYIERCTTEVTLIMREESIAAYVAGWLEMKCADDVSFSAEEALVTSDVKDFNETVSRGSLTTPHVCTFDLVRCGPCFIKEARHRACCHKRLLQNLSTQASFSGIDIDCLNMFRRLANVLLIGLHNLEKNQQKNAVLLQTSVKKAGLPD